MHYRFALIPKQLSSPFFSVTQQGCEERARQLGNVTCLYVGTEFPDAAGQSALIRDLADSGTIHGISVAVVDGTSADTLEAIAYAIEKGVPVVTFDTDAARSERLTYIGTDNFEMGFHMGKVGQKISTPVFGLNGIFWQVLLQIDPTGGFYGIISNKGSNGLEREAGVRERLRNSNWVEIDESPGDSQDSEVVSLRLMERFMAGPTAPKAILSVGGWPMRNTSSWTEFIRQHNPNLTTVVADTLPHQMDLLNYGFVTGLVGQVPFQMGVISIDTLLAHKKNSSVVPSEILGTSLQEVITVPLDLPPAVVDMHQIGNLLFMGATLVVLLFLLSVGCICWTFYYRKNRVVRASQPIFLTMIALGVLIMSLAIIPMSMDDGNFVPSDSGTVGRLACMGQVWLVSLGFTTVFAALFSKTLRINMIFHNPNRFTKMVVETRDVLAPFVLLLAANLIVLLLFTVLTPLDFVRKDHIGTDAWNRVISSYGTCQSNSQAWPYFISLVMINTGALFVALVQAFVARSIQSEFSESRYIAVVMASFMQAVVITLPVFVLVQQQPIICYLLKVGIVSILAVVVLACIFVPKMWNVHVIQSTPPQTRARSVRISFPSSDDFSTDNNIGLKLSHSICEPIGRPDDLAEPTRKTTARTA